MQTYIFWTFILAVLALACAGIALFVRAYLGGTVPSALMFRPKVDRRLAVVEFANVDSRRKLILVRRDNVEHLIMTGGPVDVVVETGISEAMRPAPEVTQAHGAIAARRAPLFGRNRDRSGADAVEPKPPEFRSDFE